MIRINIIYIILIIIHSKYFPNNNDNNFISIALLSYVQGALQSRKQHY